MIDDDDHDSLMRIKSIISDQLSIIGDHLMMLIHGLWSIFIKVLILIDGERMISIRMAVLIDHHLGKMMVLINDQ